MIDSEKNELWACNRDSTGARLILDGGMAKLISVAVDWVTGTSFAQLFIIFLHFFDQSLKAKSYGCMPWTTFFFSGNSSLPYWQKQFADNFFFERIVLLGFIVLSMKKLLFITSYLLFPNWFAGEIPAVFFITDKKRIPAEKLEAKLPADKKINK